MSLNTSKLSTKRRKAIYGLAAACLLTLICIGIIAGTGSSPSAIIRTVATGESMIPPPPSTPQLSKEYIYAGSRLLAVEDANAGAAPSPTPPPPAIEGDIVDGNGGPAGDGMVAANDVTVIRAMVLGTIPTPTPGSQFQRADAAVYDPQDTSICGDGGINSGDVTIIRQYSLGGFPPRPACGPTGPGNRPESSSQTAENKNPPVVEPNTAIPTIREIRIGPATGRRGQTVTLPVIMKMDRDELAAAFTLEYDSARLSNPRVTMSNLLPSTAVLTTNTTRPGKIGILVDAETRLSLTPIEFPLILITFDVRTTAVTGPAQIRITDSLARRSTASTRHNLLVTNYLNGDVTITN